MLDDIATNLRQFDEAVSYPPNQAFIGSLEPRALPDRPWVGGGHSGGSRFGRVGELMPEDEFIGLLAAMDEFGLLSLTQAYVDRVVQRLSMHPLTKSLPIQAIGSKSGGIATRPGDLLLHQSPEGPVGVVRVAHERDHALAAPVLLENLACKATGVLAVLRLLHTHDIDPASIDYVIGCAEEAVGDRYQRGGGNMGKAIAAAAGLMNASGADVKNFCAAPIPALVMAGSLVHAGVFRRVIVVGGGSLAKLGMKFQGQRANGLPILEDVLGGFAALVERNDGRSPVVSLSSVGRHRVKDGGSNPQIMTSLAIRPLEERGMGMLDVDDYATELHNPELTEPQGGGNVPERNYRTLGVLAAARGEITRVEVPDFVRCRGMPGFAPTQGHLASAICYLPHGLQRLTEGPAQRIQLIAKGSLFLGRMCQLSDGMSVLLERNEG